MPHERVVTELPLSTLWDGDGRESQADRGNVIGSEDIRELLRQESSLSFVLAEVGQPLRRVTGEARFAVWKDEVAPHLVEPPADMVYLDTFPEGLAYVASAWVEDAEPVVVFEAIT